MTDLLSPLTAATHPDPYPYYESLIAARAPFFDAAANLWVVADAGTIMEVLLHPQAHVRPPQATVPEPIVGSPAGEVFDRLVRMNDGVRQRRLKSLVSGVLGQLHAPQIESRAAHWTLHLSAICEVAHTETGIQDLCYRLPVYVVADLLGVPGHRLADATRWIADFVRCLAPGGSLAQVDNAKQAATNFITLIGGLLGAEGHDDSARGLLFDLRRAARVDRATTQEEVVANAIGFLSQTFEATAGLLGNAILAVATRPYLLMRDGTSTTGLHGLIAEVSRFDPSIQNTRRFLADDAVIGGQSMKAGDVILVLLAAAGRDPALNHEPNVFDPARTARRSLTFGAGPHQCPGQLLAESIATGALDVLFAGHLDVQRLVTPVSYRPSANARVPELRINIGRGA